VDIVGDLGILGADITMHEDNLKKDSENVIVIGDTIL
jgi:hypothetical protein